jgi:hypothetical protein
LPKASSKAQRVKQKIKRDAMRLNLWNIIIDPMMNTEPNKERKEQTRRTAITASFSACVSVSVLLGSDIWLTQKKKGTKKPPKIYLFNFYCSIPQLKLGGQANEEESRKKSQSFLIYFSYSSQYK